MVHQPKCENCLLANNVNVCSCHGLERRANNANKGLQAKTDVIWLDLRTESATKYAPNLCAHFVDHFEFFRDLLLNSNPRIECDKRSTRVSIVLSYALGRLGEISRAKSNIFTWNSHGFVGSVYLFLQLSCSGLSISQLCCFHVPLSHIYTLAPHLLCCATAPFEMCPTNTQRHAHGAHTRTTAST